MEKCNFKVIGSSLTPSQKMAVFLDQKGFLPEDLKKRIVNIFSRSKVPVLLFIFVGSILNVGNSMEKCNFKVIGSSLTPSQKMAVFLDQKGFLPEDLKKRIVNIFSRSKVPVLYQVSLENFYDLYNNRICKEEIENLIERYNIKNKKVLSIGPGTAHEEYWFHVSGKCELTFIDIDESGTIEPNLKKMSKKDPKIDYYIGDFLKYADESQQSVYDVLYCSSFTLDELRRSSIMRDEHRRKWMSKVNLSYTGWPFWQDPFHEVIMGATKYLKPSGLIIIQSYCGGFDFREDDNYLQNVKEQFKKNSITLLDIYYLKEIPGVVLYVGFKGDVDEALSFYDHLQIPLKYFHGRVKPNYGNEAGQFYSIKKDYSV